MKFYKVIAIAFMIVTTIVLSGCDKDEKLYYSLAAENFQGSAYHNNSLYNSIVYMVQAESINLFSQDRTLEDAKKIYESTLSRIKNTIQADIEDGYIIITEPGSVDILLLSSSYGETVKKTEIKTSVSFEPKESN